MKGGHSPYLWHKDGGKSMDQKRETEDRGHDKGVLPVVLLVLCSSCMVLLVFC